MHCTEVTIRALRLEHARVFSQQRLEEGRQLQELDAQRGAGRAGVLHRARQLASRGLRAGWMWLAQSPGRQSPRDRFSWRRARRADRASLSER